MHKVPYKQPSKFPIGTVAAMRAFARALYKAYFVDGIDISAPATVIEIARSAGIDATALATALEDPALKERAKKEVDNAIAANVFGSPFFIADGEPFWG